MLIQAKNLKKIEQLYIDKFNNKIYNTYYSINKKKKRKIYLAKNNEQIKYFQNLYNEKNKN